MKAQFSQEHIQPVAVQQPHFQLHVADQAARIVKSPESHKPGPDSQNQQKNQPGISSGGSGPGPPEELSPEASRSKNRLENAKSTLHQLTDIFNGVLEGITTSGYDPASTRNNQRLLKGAVSIAKETLSHAEANGEQLFRVQTANLYSKSLTTNARVAVTAYGKASQNAPRLANDPASIHWVFNLIQLHVTGPNGFLSDLQDQADHGPYTTDRVRKNLKTALTTLNGLQDAVSDAITKTVSSDTSNPTQSRTI